MVWSVLGFGDSVLDGRPWTEISGGFGSKAEAQTEASQEGFQSISDKALMYFQWDTQDQLDAKLANLNGGYVADTPPQTQDRGFSAPSNPEGSLFEPTATQIIDKARELEAQGLFLRVDDQGVPIKDEVAILPEIVPEILPQDEAVAPEEIATMNGMAGVFLALAFVGAVVFLGGKK